MGDPCIRNPSPLQYFGLLGTLLVKYVGIPIISTKLLLVYGSLLIDKMICKVWYRGKKPCLMLVECRLLRGSCLVSKYIRAYILFILYPKFLEWATFRKFLWSLTESYTISHNVSWELISRPKNEGGLVAKIGWVEFCWDDVAHMCYLLKSKFGSG